MLLTVTAAEGGLAGMTARHGPPWADGPHSFHPVFGVAMILLLFLIGLAVFVAMRRSGRRPPWARTAPEPPENGAKRVLAERFARGDIGVDEFLERASVLNWTPGSDTRGRK